ncbi:MAG: PQQ-binding-like beta-propeller repeat protein, partial [Planctomycetota bacterium]
KWRFRTGLHADLDTPVILRDDGILFFTARDHNLYALVPGSAEPLHREPLGAYCPHAPLIYLEKDAPKAIFALEDLRILVKPPELAEKAETVFDAEGTLAAGPAEFEGILVFGDQAGDLHAFDLVTAQPKWKTPLGSPVTAPPTLHEGIAYVGTREGRVFAIDIAEGKVLPGWPFKAEAPITTTPVIHGDLLLAGGESGHLTALDRRGGTFSWKISVGGAIRSKPFTIGYTVYLGADDGALYALDIPGRAIRWVFQTGGSIRGAPVLSEGMVLFGSGDGNFYAIKE